MTERNCDIEPDRVVSAPLTLVRVITAPKIEDVRSVVVSEFAEGQPERYECNPAMWNKDILFFPREWSPDPDVHSNFYDEGDQDSIEVRPAGAIAQWIRSNAEFEFFSVAGNEIRVILNQRQAALIRDRFGLYPPTPACAAGDAAPDKS